MEKDQIKAQLKTMMTDTMRVHSAEIDTHLTMFLSGEDHNGESLTYLRKALPVSYQHLKKPIRDRIILRKSIIAGAAFAYKPSKGTFLKEFSDIVHVDGSADFSNYESLFSVHESLESQGDLIGFSAIVPNQVYDVLVVQYVSVGATEKQPATLKLDFIAYGREDIT